MNSAIAKSPAQSIIIIIISLAECGLHSHPFKKKYNELLTQEKSSLYPFSFAMTTSITRMG